MPQGRHPILVMLIEDPMSDVAAFLPIVSAHKKEGDGAGLLGFDVCWYTDEIDIEVSQNTCGHEDEAKGPTAHAPLMRQRRAA